MMSTICKLKNKMEIGEILQGIVQFSFFISFSSGLLIRTFTESKKICPQALAFEEIRTSKQLMKQAFFAKNIMS